MFSSFGAVSVYELPACNSGQLNIELVGFLFNGPGRIAPAEFKGLIGFPLFHAAITAFMVLYGRSLARMAWALLV